MGKLTYTTAEVQAKLDAEANQLLKDNNLSDLENAQDALNNITQVAGATNEYVLTKDTATGDAIWKEVVVEPTQDIDSVLANGDIATDKTQTFESTNHSGLTVLDAGTIITSAELNEINNSGNDITITTFTDGTKETVASQTTINSTGITATMIITDTTAVFDDTARAAMAIGTAFWDVDYRCWTIKTGADTYQQVGAELPMLMKNVDTVTHSNGQPVYVYGGTGKKPSVKLANATSHNSATVIALATEDVLHTGNGLGMYTVYGEVNNVPYTNIKCSTDNYADWVEGIQLWLSTETGKLTVNKPAAPYHAALVGTITDKSGSNVTIFVAPNNGYDLGELHDVNTTGAVPGDILTLNSNSVWVAGNQFVDTDFKGIPSSEVFKWVPSYNPSTRILTVTLVSDSYYYVKGIKYTIAAGAHDWPAHANTNGTYFFYFNASGVATTSAVNTAWDILTTCQVFVGVYNSNNNGTGANILLLEERHPTGMSAATHKRLHKQGTIFTGGGGLSSYVIQSDTTADVTWAMDRATFSDENIDLISNAQAASNYLFGYFDSTNSFNWMTQGDLPYLYGANRIMYNLIGTGLVELPATNDQYVNYYVFLVNSYSASQRVLVIPGQHIYTSLQSAQAEGVAGLNMANFPFTEYVLLWQMTYRLRTNYSATTKYVRLEAEPVKQNQNNVTMTGGASLHNNLSGRFATDCHNTAAITGLDTILSGLAGLTIQNILNNGATAAIAGNITLNSTAGNITLGETGRNITVSPDSMAMVLGNFSAGLQASGWHVNDSGSSGQASLAGNYWLMRGTYSTKLVSIAGETTKLELIYNNNKLTMTDDNTASTSILSYTSDLSSSYTDRSLVDKEYVDTAIGNIPIPSGPQSGFAVTKTGNLPNMTIITDKCYVTDGVTETLLGVELKNNYNYTADTITNPLISISYDNLLYLNTEFNFSSENCTTIEFPALSTMTGYININNCTNLTTISLDTITDALDSTNTNKGIHIQYNPALTTIELPLLANIESKLNINNNPLVTSINISSIETIAGSGEVTLNNLDLSTDLDLSNLTSCIGYLTLQGSSMSDLLVPNVSMSNGYFTIDGCTIDMLNLGSPTYIANTINVFNSTISEFDLSNLEYIFNPGQLTLFNNTMTTPVDLSSLAGIDGTLIIGSTDIPLPALTTVDGTLYYSDINFGTTLDISNITKLYALGLNNCTVTNLDISGTRSLPIIRLNGSSVTNVDASGALSCPWTSGVSSNSSLVTFNISSLSSITGSLSFINCSALTTVTFGAAGRLLSSTDISFYGCALSQSCVDAILSVYAAMDGTNGTTLFNGSLNLTGGTNAIPTNTAAIASLQGQGATVTVNS